MKENSIKYPRIWQHKKNKGKMRVMPWWETVKDGEFEEVDELGHAISVVAEGRTCKFGVLVQIGYLIENEHGIWFGVGPDVAKEFKDMGPEKRPEKTLKEKP